VVAALRARLSARIRWKILAPYLMLSLMLAALATYFVTRTVSGSFEERFVNQLAESARVTGDAVVRRERAHLEAVRAVAFTAGANEAASSANADDIAGIVLPVAANSSTELIAVFGIDRSLIYAARLTEPDTLEYAPVSASALAAADLLVRAVLEGGDDERGDKFAALAVVPGGPALLTAGPIRDGDDITGVVLVGSPLSTFLLGVKHQALADITFYAATGEPLGSTFVIDQDSQLEEAPVEELQPGLSNPRRTYLMAGRPFQFLYAPLYVRGEPIGVMSVALPTAFVTSADQTTRSQMAVLFGIATVAVLVIGVVLSRLLTLPLARLVRVAAAITAGDLTARSGMTSSDEIGTLATTLDTMTDRLQRQHLGTIRALVTAIDARDPYTRGHSVRVGNLSVDLGTGLGLSDAQRQHLQVGGYLHDIGKIGVRDAVLLKPSSLSVEERMLIEEHPRVGLEILESVMLPAEVLAVVGQHHERLDGTGYPFKLSEEELTVFPRIAAVADVYDALTTDRPYRAGMSTLDALAILGREAEQGLLDPEVVAAMIREAGRWEERLRDDPALKGLEPASGLYIPANTVPSHEHTHGHEHPHAAA